MLEISRSLIGDGSGISDLHYESLISLFTNSNVEKEVWTGIQNRDYRLIYLLTSGLFHLRGEDENSKSTFEVFPPRDPDLVIRSLENISNNEYNYLSERFSNKWCLMESETQGKDEVTMYRLVLRGGGAVEGTLQFWREMVPFLLGHTRDAEDQVPPPEIILAMGIAGFFDKFFDNALEDKTRDIPQSYWEVSDWLLHASSRRLRNWADVGTRKNYSSASQSERKVSTSSGPNLSVDEFIDLLARRRSCRNGGFTNACDKEFLKYCLSLVENPEFGSTARPWPTAGGLAGITVWYLPPSGSKVMEFDFERGSLVESSINPSSAKIIRSMCLNATGIELKKTVGVVFGTMNIEILWKKYTGIAYANALKEWGCITQTFYMLSSLSKFGVCAVGTGIPYVNIDGQQYPVVGELAVFDTNLISEEKVDGRE